MQGAFRVRGTSVTGARRAPCTCYPGVYAKCEALGWPIICMPRMKKYYRINLCGNAYDSGNAARLLKIGV